MNGDNSRLNQSEKTRARGPSDEWLAGWRAAMRRAATLARQIEIPEDCSAIEAHGRLMGALNASEAIHAAMEPPA